jgi:hypothetical protein
MGDRKFSQQRRYAALVVVAALHLGLVAVLIAGSRIRSASPAAESVTTTLVAVPKTPEPLAKGPAPELHLAPLAPVAPFVPALPSISYPTDNMPQAIDWQAEGQKAAAAITGSRGVPSEDEDRRKTSSSHGPRPWVPPPAHHAGEQYTTITGEKIVWISDKCFVMSSRPTLGLPDIFARARLSTTICPRTSGTARGDLFEALPAYKKYHPEPDPAK